jgi:hypothetical protein
MKLHLAAHQMEDEEPRDYHPAFLERLCEDVLAAES